MDFPQVPQNNPKNIPVQQKEEQKFKITIELTESHLNQLKEWIKYFSENPCIDLQQGNSYLISRPGITMGEFCKNLMGAGLIYHTNISQIFSPQNRGMINGLLKKIGGLNLG